MAEDGRILPIVDFHYPGYKETSVDEHYTGLHIKSFQTLYARFLCLDVESTAVILSSYLFCENTIF